MSNFQRLASRFIMPGAKTGNDLRLEFDLESNGLLDTVSTIHCIVITDLNADRVDAFGPKEIPAALARLAEADVLVGHNIAAYDLPVLYKLHGWAPAARVRIIDTLIASRLILPNIDDLDDQAAAMGDRALGKLRGRYSLEAWGARLGIPKVGADIEDWSAWTAEMQARCVGDVALCKALFHFLQVDGYCAEALTLEHRVAEVCERISADGVPFDAAAAKELERRWTGRHAELGAALARQFPGTNLGSRPQIGALLEARGWVPQKRTEKTGKPAINDEVLETIPALFPEFAGLAEYDLLRRRIAQLAGGKQALLRHVDAAGRIHGAIVHIGTPHSRAKHMTPNIAQVPNPKKGAAYAAEFRALFRHPEDWLFVTCDQANLQDRGFAHRLAEFDGGAYAREFLSGVDMHWKNVVALGLLPEGTARSKDNALHTALREGSKRFRYGFLFGAGVGRCGEILRDTVRSAQQLEPGFRASTDGGRARDRFIAATPGLAALRGRLEDLVERRQWLPGLDGRRVPCAAKYTALNYAVTSIEAIVCKRWLVAVYDELRARFRYGWDGDVVLVLWVHDEIAACCRPEIAEHAGEILARHAVAAGEHFKLKVPLAGDYKIGRSWAGDDAVSASASAKPTDAAKSAPKPAEPVKEPAGLPEAAAEPESAPESSGSDKPEPESAPESEPNLEFEAFFTLKAGLEALKRTHAAPPNSASPDAGATPPPPRGAPRSNSHPPGADDDRHEAGKPYGPIRDALVNKGYRVAKTFGFLVPGQKDPLFSEDRFELNPAIAPTKERPRKTCRFWHHNGAGIALNGTGPRRIVYNWPAIMAVGPGAAVFIAEGANKCDLLNGAGLCATAAPYHKWEPECISALAGRDLIYLEDHDLPDANGKITAKRLSADAQARLAPGAKAFRIVPAAHNGFEPASSGTITTSTQDPPQLSSRSQACAGHIWQTMSHRADVAMRLRRSWSDRFMRPAAHRRIRACR
jgi:DNA polymerase I-like protein with 3'-5' exonuclease and polymerase domains